jgi:hypothetical protein
VLWGDWGWQGQNPLGSFLPCLSPSHSEDSTFLFPADWSFWSCQARRLLGTLRCARVCVHVCMCVGSHGPMSQHTSLIQ